MALSSRQLRTLRGAETPPSGNKVSVAIELVGMRQSELAAALGMSQSHLSDLLRGRYHSLSLENARRFAGHFGCAIEDLFPSRQAVA